ncbi:GNAT family N-acetyltransferase [Sporanaerobium hydrogeniformans]|uniref:GNAT family N-acetyltransferase n=1 Tax=Sporanaerobium hydrogeniformans TaxID=3072179 RepID=A0AC61DD92_9FIRM|nr:GNAT family N-acetyltransferase [Sporanaerobium hydrogeniformans]PHV70706.1 GNAT family N-acetyltransferase [Sporanaerobium hydrogeniformans]
MNKVLLKEFSDDNIPLLKKWLYIPHVAAWYHAPLDWLEEVEKRNDEFSFLHHFIVEVGNHTIGFCQFYEYHYSGEDWHGNTDVDGTYSIDYLIGDIEYLGKGYGTAIIKALIEKIKMQNNAKRIIVQPEPENKASCNTLLSCGFSFDKFNEIYILDL